MVIWFSLRFALVWHGLCSIARHGLEICSRPITIELKEKGAFMENVPGKIGKLIGAIGILTLGFGQASTALSKTQTVVEERVSTVRTTTTQQRHYNEPFARYDYCDSAIYDCECDDFIEHRRISYRSPSHLRVTKHRRYRNSRHYPRYSPSRVRVIKRHRNNYRNNSRVRRHYQKDPVIQLRVKPFIKVSL